MNKDKEYTVCIEKPFLVVSLKRRVNKWSTGNLGILLFLLFVLKTGENLYVYSLQ